MQAVRKLTLRSMQSAPDGLKQYRLPQETQVIQTHVVLPQGYILLGVREHPYLPLSVGGGHWLSPSPLQELPCLKLEPMIFSIGESLVCCPWNPFSLRLSFSVCLTLFS